MATNLVRIGAETKSVILVIFHRNSKSFDDYSKVQHIQQNISLLSEPGLRFNLPFPRLGCQKRD